MLLKILSTLIYLIHTCVNTSTSPDPKTGISYELPLSRQDFTPYHDGRDRRTAHWEPRAHSNLDDDSINDGRNRGLGRISYSSLLEEPSLLGVPARFETSGKSSKNFNLMENNDDDPNSDVNRCNDYVPIPSRSLSSWLSFIKARLNLENSQNLPFASMDNDKFPISRCRRKLDSWSIQEPIYVEEPKWIVIEINGQNSRSRSLNQQDPFYVARGKRSITHSLNEEKTKNDNRQISKNFASLKSVSSSKSLRKKRDALDENLRKYLSDGVSGGNIFSSTGLIDKNPGNRYLQPRDKHSDILDILNEPFFISRGKKNSLDIRRSEMENLYSKEHVNFETRRQIFDTWLATEAIKNCDSSSPDCALFHIRSLRTSRLDGSRPTVNHRGEMDDILKETDPFYVARGKRSLDSRVMGESNEKSTLRPPSAEVTTENLSMRN